ncbi:hypothetical protein KKC45_01405 [Patescibacteria group bacterium]|nr:hypothetical protein [Patescibacteria group bacterium]
MKKVLVRDKMQKKYSYIISEPVGKNFAKDFKPELTPKEMLELGVFGGRYMRDCRKEFPKNWFTKAKLHPEKTVGHSPELNYFKVDASQPLKVWKEKGWIYKEDPRGWFQWYCRYYIGRRIPEEDKKQISRWKAYTRHLGAVKNNCKRKDLDCRPKQRQSLLHWAYDSRKI